MRKADAIKNMASAILQGMEREQESQTLEQVIESSQGEIQEEIKKSLEGMTQRMTAMASEVIRRVSGGSEDEEALTYNPDRRTIAGLGSFVTGIIILLIFPSFLKWLAILFILIAAVVFQLRYVLNARTNIRDGFKGISSRWGEPTGVTKTGRNWFLNLSQSIPFIVSDRDLVYTIDTTGFTKDVGQITWRVQVTAKITDPIKFVLNSSPGSMRKMILTYGRYLSLRLITSIQDSRVKFTGTERLDNFVQAMNANFPGYGFEITRATMVPVENPVLDKIEWVRTTLNEVDMLKENLQTRLEAAVKAVENNLRQLRRQSRVEALKLVSEKTRLDAFVGEAVSAQRATLLINARRRLEEKKTALDRALQEMVANVDKAKRMHAIKDQLKRTFDLRLAKIRRRMIQEIMPETVTIVNVDGIGQGLGLGIGFNRVPLLKGLQKMMNTEESIEGTDK